MENLLKSKGYWDRVQPADNEAYQAAAANEQKAMAEIVTTLGDDMVRVVLDCQTARDVWVALRTHAEINTAESADLIDHLMRSTKFRDSGSMRDHIEKLKHYKRRLAQAGQDIGDPGLITVLLNSLPPSWKVEKNVLRARPNNTVDYVCQYLVLEQDSRRAGSDSKGDPVNEEFALAVECFNCHQKGHIKRNCPRNKGKSKGGGAKQGQWPRSKQAGNANFALTCATGDHWILDSGASLHLTGDKTLLLDPVENRDAINIPDGQVLRSSLVGSTLLKFTNGNSVHISNVHAVEGIKVNLLSVSQLIKNGAKVEFNIDEAVVSKEGQVVFTARLTDGIYTVAGIGDHANSMVNVRTWHERLAHAPHDVIMETLKQTKTTFHNDLKGSELICDSCLSSKDHAGHKPQAHEAKPWTKFELIHSDILGPVNPRSMSNKRYVLTFLDERTSFGTVFFLAEKGQAFNCFVQFVKFVERQFGVKVKALRSDNGGEYCSTEFQSYLKNEGIQHQRTNSNSPFQNGKAERFNRSLMDKTRAVLQGLPRSLWAEGLNYVNYVRNLTWNRVLSMSPYQAAYGIAPDLKDLRIFGTRVSVKDTNAKTKLSDRNNLGTFIGNVQGVKGWKVLLDNGKVMTSRDVNFLERPRASPPATTVDISLPGNDDFNIIPDDDKEPLAAPVDEDLEPKDFVESSDDLKEEDAQEDQPPAQEDQPPASNSGRPVRDRRPPVRLIDQVLPMKFFGYSGVTTESEPQNADEAFSRSMWQDAMKVELASLIHMDSWDIVPMSKAAGHSVIPSKWVFKTKFDKSGNVIKRKARLVARGDRQVTEDPTYSPVVRMTTFRLLMAVAVKKDFIVEQMDVDSAYLYGRAPKDTFMQLPKYFCELLGSEEYTHTSHALKLKGCIYGLKQSGRQWNARLVAELMKLGFQQSSYDLCLFCRKDIYVLVYVDDLLLFSQRKDTVEHVKTMLKKVFRMKDLGTATWFLGVNIEYGQGRIDLSQGAYVDMILKRYNMSNAKPKSTPLDPNMRLVKALRSVSSFPFQECLGSIMYLQCMTRPDLAYPVSVLSSFVNEPSDQCIEAIKHMLKYLLGSRDAKLSYCKDSPMVLESWSDADWGSDSETRRSISGSGHLLCGGVVEWRSKKQTVVALSSTEAEYVSISECARDIVWLRGILNDVGCSQHSGTVIFEDNQAAISLLLHEKQVYKRTKHIEVKFHHVRDLLEKGVIQVRFVPTEHQVADIFTKQLPKAKFLRLLGKLGLCLMPRQA